MIKIKNLADRGEIYIYGTIIDDTDAQWLRDEDGNLLGYQFPADIKEQLDALKGKPIDIHISSDGGSVSAGIAIANMIASHDAPTTAIIDSWAASIASVIAMSANTIKMYDSSFLMIHNPAVGGVFGNSDLLRSVADWLDKIKEIIAQTYAKHSSKPLDEIFAKMDDETWFTAREASEFFNNVEIIEGSELKAVAKVDMTALDGYNHVPEAVKDMLTEDVVENAQTTEEATEDTTDNNDSNDEIKNKILDVLRGAYNYEEKS